MDNNIIDKAVEGFLPETKGYSKAVLEAMNYSVLGSGKRIRPRIMYLTYNMLGGKCKAIESFMAAIEMIHSYSLVHDDLPAMDNDLLRRGKPTTWSKYGENIGILAGDGLLNLAFETMGKGMVLASDEEKNNTIKAFNILANKAGVYGMIGGQTLDVVSNGENLTADELIYIHKLKTCALLEAAFMVGGVLAGCDEKTCEVLELIGRNVGMAFQIQDDILDVTGDEAVLGKPIHSDEKNLKTTYVTLYGIEKASTYVKEYSEEAIKLLSGLPCNEYKDMISALIVELINRKR